MYTKQPAKEPSHVNFYRDIEAAEYAVKYYAVFGIKAVASGKAVFVYLD